ncbi:MAG: hypothetical protein J6A11_04920 [Lachnospiraceae bacterium]|nr:hypothetical protein [Lachnospiraceae bacterium]
MFGLLKKNQLLENKLQTLQMNFENNYKDAAKLNYEEYWKMLDELTDSGKLKGKQIDYYKQRGEDLRGQMNNFNHQNNVKTF